jgi:hypothetical protein
MRFVSRSVAVLVMVTGLGAGPAAAGMILTPFVGTTWGSGAEDDFGDTSNLVYGGTITFVGEGPLGFEIDGQYAPDFFGEADNSNVASLMGAFLLGAHDDGARLRFYVLGGGGLLRTRIEDTNAFFETDRNSFGVMFGGSVIALVSENLGLKGDIRYFRGITDVEPDSSLDLDLTGFHFWRASAGLAIAF